MIACRFPPSIHPPAIVLPEIAITHPSVDNARPSERIERFGILAGAIAGRSVAVAGCDDERSYTDGEVIFVGQAGRSRPAATIVAQASLLVAGSLEPAIMAQLVGRKAARHRYLTLEVARGAHLLHWAVPRSTLELIRRLYDGPLTGSARESLELAGTGRGQVPEAPAWLGTIRPVKLLSASPGDGGAPTKEDLEGTSRRDPGLGELDEDEESERSKILEALSAPNLKMPFSNLFQNLLGSGRSPDAGAGGGELPVGSTRTGPVGARAKVIKLATDLRAALAGGQPVGRRYPEWDYRRDAYRDDWCAVAEFDPPQRDEADAEQIVTDPLLRRELARLGLARERYRRQSEGDVIDVSALVDFAAARAAGHVEDAAIYELSLRTRHDLGILILLDATGSTGESPHGRRIFDQQREVVARLTSALDELGDRVATYAFYSQGRESVRFLRIKEFDERYGAAARTRLASLRPAGFTRLGAAIRHGTQLLESRAGASNMLLVVVGDGLPYDDGYEHRYAQDDCSKALSEAIATGVGCACLSVNASTDDEVVARVWGHVSHRRLENPGELRRHVGPLFRDALRVAASSQKQPGGGRAGGRGGRAAVHFERSAEAVAA